MKHVPGLLLVVATLAVIALTYLKMPANPELHPKPGEYEPTLVTLAKNPELFALSFVTVLVAVVAITAVRRWRGTHAA